MPHETAFFSFMLLTAFTPGPNNIMAMSIAGQHGQLQGLRFCVGVLLGFLGIMIACALSSSTLYRQLPGLEPGMRVVGAVYMFWLAWKMLGAGKSGGSGDRHTRPEGIISGMLLQCVNPKVIAYGVTAFSAFIVPYYTTYQELLFFALLLALVGFGGTCCWSLCGGVLRECFVRYPRVSGALTALLMGGCGVSLLLQR